MANELVLKDVYDYAYDIAQEFNTIIEFVDVNQVSLLINKVINILELLEDAVKQIEQLEQENASLRSKYIQWNSEKKANEEENLHLKQAFEDLEESWSQEAGTLKSIISKLKMENQSLMHNISANKEMPIETDIVLKSAIKDQEKLIVKLQSNLKKRDTQLEKNNLTIELLNSKFEHVLKLNRSLHLRYQEVKDLLKASYSENYEQKFKQDQQEQKFCELEKRYDELRKSHMKRKENELSEDIELHKIKSIVNEEYLKSFLEEQRDLKETILKLQNELVLVKCENEEYKRKLTKQTDIGKSFTGNTQIQQIFRLFLGAIHISI